MVDLKSQDRSIEEEKQKKSRASSDHQMKMKIGNSNSADALFHKLPRSIIHAKISAILNKILLSIHVEDVEWLQHNVSLECAIDHHAKYFTPKDASYCEWRSGDESKYYIVGLLSSRFDFSFVVNLFRIYAAINVSPALFVSVKFGVNQVSKIRKAIQDKG